MGLLSNLDSFLPTLPMYHISVRVLLVPKLFRIGRHECGKCLPPTNTHDLGNHLYTLSLVVVRDGGGQFLSSCRPKIIPEPQAASSVVWSPDVVRLLVCLQVMMTRRMRCNGDDDDDVCIVYDTGRLTGGAAAAAVKMEHFQPALDPRKQELLEARFLGARVSPRTIII